MLALINLHIGFPIVVSSMPPSNIKSHTFYHTWLQHNLHRHSKGKGRTLFHLHLQIMICCIIFQFQNMGNKIGMILILRLYLKMILIQIQLLFQIRIPPWSRSNSYSGTGKGCNKLTGCWCSTFTRWHFMHLEMYSAMPFFIPSQKYFFLAIAIAFWYPGWPEYRAWWISSITTLLKYSTFGI